MLYFNTSRGFSFISPDYGSLISSELHSTHPSLVLNMISQGMPSTDTSDTPINIYSLKPSYFTSL